MFNIIPPNSGLVPFKEEHVLKLIDEPINFQLRDWVKSGAIKNMEQTDAVSFFIGDELMVCGGIGEAWTGRGHMWSFFSEKSKYHFVPVFRVIKTWVDHMLEIKYNRLEMSVIHDWEMGHRRARLLGFELEIPFAKKYLPNGDGCAIYSKVRQ